MAPFNMKKNLWGKMCLNNPKIQKNHKKFLFLILLHGFIFPLTKKLQYEKITSEVLLSCKYYFNNIKCQT